MKIQTISNHPKILTLLAQLLILKLILFKELLLDLLPILFKPLMSIMSKDKLLEHMGMLPTLCKPQMSTMFKDKLFAHMRMLPILFRFLIPTMFKDKLLESMEMLSIQISTPLILTLFKDHQK